ncbi:DUF2806 domain-containing protein, partial [Acetobacter sacchari]
APISCAEMLTRDFPNRLLVPDVAKKISADPVLLERATLEMMGNAYINQENRESVAEVALKDVVDKHDDHSESNEPLDEDWLNIFSSYAEKASTERTRQLWGRILSGEVRHQGRFSLSTLRILSEIDKKIANNFSEHACLFFSNGSLPYSIEKINENEIDFIGMQECGIIDSLSTNRKTNFTPDMDLTCSISMDNILINILFRAKITAHINTIFLTKSGRELCHLIDAVPNIQRQAQAVSEAIKENHIISKCSIFEIKQVKANGFVDYFTPAIIDWEK